MSIYVIRTCLTAGDISWSLCSRWKHNAGLLQASNFQSFGLKNSLKTSKWNLSRWPGRSNSTLNPAVNNFKDNYALNRLWKPFIFTITVSGASLAGAAIWQYENVRSQAVRAKRFYSGLHTAKYGQFRQHMHSWWQNLSIADKTFWPICFLNTLVFLAWRVPAWQPVMTKYFTAGLVSKSLCWPMLFSVFSHYSFLHLAANMFVLHSFSENAVNALGREQFVGMYLTAGVVSSFTSYLFKALTKSPTSSLGASGAVMCVLAYVCSKYPHSQLAVIFLPQFPFDAGMGLKALVLMDSVGCILRWTFFDHAAHLGGSLFGIVWHNWGHEYIWRKREPLVSLWHQFRGNI